MNQENKGVKSNKVTKCCEAEYYSDNEFGVVCKNCSRPFTAIKTIPQSLEEKENLFISHKNITHSIAVSKTCEECIKINKTFQKAKEDGTLDKLLNPPTDSNWEEEFIEKGADLEHKRWAKWQKYMHSKILPSAHDEIMEIGTEMINHWNRQINTPYSELTEKEKDSDRKEVRQYLPLIRNLIQSERKEVIGKHNAHILNEWQLKGLGDERVLFPILEKATEISLSSNKPSNE